MHGRAQLGALKGSASRRADWAGCRATVVCLAQFESSHTLLSHLLEGVVRIPAPYAYVAPLAVRLETLADVRHTEERSAQRAVRQGVLAPLLVFW